MSLPGRNTSATCDCGWQSVAYRRSTANEVMRKLSRKYEVSNARRIEICKNKLLKRIPKPKLKLTRVGG